MRTTLAWLKNKEELYWVHNKLLTNPININLNIFH